MKERVCSFGSIFFPLRVDPFQKGGKYRKNSKYWDMYVRANSLDSDQTALEEQSDQDLHCLPFFLHLLEALLHCKIKLFYIKDNYGSWSGYPNI